MQRGMDHSYLRYLTYYLGGLFSFPTLFLVFNIVFIFHLRLSFGLTCPPRNIICWPSLQCFIHTRHVWMPVCLLTYYSDTTLSINEQMKYE